MTGNYISSYDVKMLAQISYEDLGFNTDGDYETWLDEDLIPRVEGIIEKYCDVPSGFFVAGGVAVSNELRDYREDGISLKYSPIVIITKVEINTAGCGSTETWSATTKYVENLDLGTIRIVSVSPGCDDQGVRVTYTAGFVALPSAVEYACIQLAANVLHATLQRKISPTVRVGDFTIKLVVPSCFTKEIKELLKPFTRMKVSVG